MVQMFMRDLKKVSALERFCYKGFLRNSSGTKYFVRLREVSALEDVRFREAPLCEHKKPLTKILYAPQRWYQVSNNLTAL